MAEIGGIFMSSNQEAGCDCDNVMAELASMPLGKLYKNNVIRYEEDFDDNAIDETVWDDMNIGG